MIWKEGGQLDQETDKMVYGQAQSLNDFTSQENQIFENKKLRVSFYVLYIPQQRELRFHGVKSKKFTSLPYPQRKRPVLERTLHIYPHESDIDLL